MTHKEIIKNSIDEFIWIKYRNKIGAIHKLVVKIKKADEKTFVFQTPDTKIERRRPYDSIIDLDVNADSFLEENFYMPTPPPVEKDFSYLDKF